MALIIRNHGLAFRPLRGGIGIVNPTVAEMGTLGFVATRDGQDRWIVSCYHVLCHRTLGAATDGASVFQPSRGSGATAIACVDAARSDPGLDCAAARVVPGIDCLPWILGIGRVGAVQRAEVGMHVVKSGLATGVTEGVVLHVAGSQVEIGTRSDHPDDYDLCAAGDSGAVWLDASTRGPVALHRGARAGDKPCAQAVDIAAVLASLGLDILA